MADPSSPAPPAADVADDPDTASVVRFLDPRRWRPYFAEVDREVWVICVVAAIGLALSELVFRTSLFTRFAPTVVPADLDIFIRAHKPTWASLLPIIWWIGGGVVVWILVPLLAAKLLLGRGPRDYGMRWLGWRKMAPYAVLLLAFFPILITAAFWLPGFKTSYPLFRGHWTWTNFLIFEALYGLQFVSVEFFFRGFMVNGLGRTLGYRAILVSMIPYVMIHNHKPFLEANAAIIAGIVLGAFALRTRSVWGGLMLHLGVAWGMDILSILGGSRGGFPKTW